MIVCDICGFKDDGPADDDGGREFVNPCVLKFWGNSHTGPWPTYQCWYLGDFCADCCEVDFLDDLWRVVASHKKKKADTVKMPGRNPHEPVNSRPEPTPAPPEPLRA